MVRACVMLSSTGPTAHFAKHPLRFIAQPLRVRLLRRAVAPAVRQLYRMQGFPSYLTDDEQAFALLDAAAFDFSAHRSSLAGCAPDVGRVGRRRPVITLDLSRSLIRCSPWTATRFADGGHNVQKTPRVTSPGHPANSSAELEPSPG